MSLRPVPLSTLIESVNSVPPIYLAPISNPAVSRWWDLTCIAAFPPVVTPAVLASAAVGRFVANLSHGPPLPFDRALGEKARAIRVSSLCPLFTRSRHRGFPYRSVSQITRFMLRKLNVAAFCSALNWVTGLRRRERLSGPAVSIRRVVRFAEPVVARGQLRCRPQWRQSGR